MKIKTEIWRVPHRLRTTIYNQAKSTALLSFLCGMYLYGKNWWIFGLCVINFIMSMSTILSKIKYDKEVPEDE